MSDVADYLRLTAERELRDALLRYLARIRHRAAPLEEVYAVYSAALRREADMVDLVVNGALLHGGVVAYAEAIGADAKMMARQGAAEVERMAAVLELVPEKLTGGEHHYY